MLFGANCIGKGAGGKYAVCALRIEKPAEKMVLQCALAAHEKSPSAKLATGYVSGAPENRRA